MASNNTFHTAIIKAQKSDDIYEEMRLKQNIFLNEVYNTTNRKQ